MFIFSRFSHLSPEHWVISRPFIFGATVQYSTGIHGKLVYLPHGYPFIHLDEEEQTVGLAPGDLTIQGQRLTTESPLPLRV